MERCGADGANKPNAVIFFYSHRWARGNWCEELQRELPWGSEEYKRAVAEGKLVGDPDDAAHSKATALAAYGEWFREGLAKGSFAKDALPLPVAADLPLLEAGVEIFWWIDWCCTDQVSRGTAEGATRLLCFFASRTHSGSLSEGGSERAPPASWRPPALPPRRPPRPRLTAADPHTRALFPHPSPSPSTPHPPPPSSLHV